MLKPEIWLDGQTLRRNVRVWRERAAGANVRAVIKSDGYGWGFATIVHAIDDVVDGYYVSDADEFDAVRPLTERPIATLAEVAPERVASLLDRGGIPTVATFAGVRTAAAWARTAGTRARVRLALRGAIGWAGLDADEIPSFAAALGGADIDVEFSSHLTDGSLRRDQTRVFKASLARLRSAGVTVVASDLVSSAPLAARRAPARSRAGSSHVRLGAALFGARFASRVAGASAIRVRAPLVEVHRARSQHLGYGVQRAPRTGYLAVVRCGFGDGFPKLHDKGTGVLAVGMQFTTVLRPEVPAGAVDLIDESTDLDALAARAGVTVHQLIVGLGLAARFNPAASSRANGDARNPAYAGERGG